jgi:glutathione S-transferase
MHETAPRVLHRPRCPLSRRLLAYLEEKALSVRLVELDPAHHGEELRRLNPKGDLPVYEQGDGLVLWDSFLIMEFLEEAHPRPRLLPADSECRARMRLLFDLADDLLQPALVAFARASMDDAERLANETRFLEALARVTPLLSHDGPFAIGKGFTLADLSVPPLVLRAVEAGLDPARLPVRIRLWVQTVLDRPSLRRIFPEVRLRRRAA